MNLYAFAIHHRIVIVLANRFISLTTAVRSSEEQLAARTGTQLIDGSLLLALMSRRRSTGVLLLLLLLLPGRVSLHRNRRFQAFYIDGLGVKPDGSMNAL